MSLFAENLKYLRKSKNLSQDALAKELDFKRTTLSGYENEFSEPSIEVLTTVSNYFNISIDALVRHNLSKLSDKELHEILEGIASDMSGRQLRVLATTVSENNEENVEMVPISARAGYTAGYADPEFIATLPMIRLPFLSPNRKYRAFSISGDSMPPVSDGSLVVGEFVVDWRDLKSGDYYIVLTKDDGVVFKRVFERVKKNGCIHLTSTNPVYDPYEIHIDEVLEIWKFNCYIAFSLAHIPLTSDTLSSMVMELKRDVGLLKTKLGE